ncbi:MAG TPA: hypothetical protein VH560_03745 [Polyangia bacterium]|nr:hypothetical protein [Polyangia bacterium]
MASVLAACGTVERVSRPPSAAEIAHINAAIDDGRNVVILAPVDFVTYPAQQPACAGGGCGARVEPLRECVAGVCGAMPPRPIKDPPRSIAFADDRQIVFDTRRGGTLTLPMNLVTGVKISGANRAGGVAVGLGLGALVDLGVGAVIFTFRHLAADDGGAGASPCGSICEAEVGLALLPALVGGALGGYAIGVPERFIFDDRATTAP